MTILELLGLVRQMADNSNPGCRVVFQVDKEHESVVFKAVAASHEDGMVVISLEPEFL